MMIYYWIKDVDCCQHPGLCADHCPRRGDDGSLFRRLMSDVSSWEQRVAPPVNAGHTFICQALQRRIRKP